MSELSERLAKDLCRARFRNLCEAEVAEIIHKHLKAHEAAIAEATATRDMYSDQLDEIRALFDSPPQYGSRMNLLKKVEEIANRNPLCDTPLSKECHELRLRVSDLEAELRTARLGHTDVAPTASDDPE